MGLKLVKNFHPQMYDLYRLPNIATIALSGFQRQWDRNQVEKQKLYIKFGVKSITLRNEHVWGQY